MASKSLYLLLIFFTLYSCNSYEKILNGSDFDLKYTTGMQYYDYKDYYKASPLLESVVALYRGSLKGEKLYYRYANCQYKLGELYSAAFHFKTFYELYPQSIYAKKSLFLSGYISYLLSPHYSLDQSDSKQAMNQLQKFANTYPEDLLTDSCNKIMDKLFEKFKKKKYENALNYYNTEKYQAAIITMNNFINQYPSNKNKHYLKLMILDAYFKLYKNSIDKKKQERFEQAMNYYNKFVKGFDGDEEILKKSKKIYKKTLDHKNTYQKKKITKLNLKKIAYEF